MARRLKEKIKEVQEVSKFGGTEKVADVNIERDPYEISTIEAQSKTKLEFDKGEGNPIIIRQFQFGLNPVAWQNAPPAKQDLFNYHLKGIEMLLWRDGLKPHIDIEPRLVVDAEKMKYSIFITAVPMRGHLLTQTPQTLREIAQH